MMPNLAYRGFLKNRCMQVVDTTSVFNGPFLSHNWSSQSQCSASYQKRSVGFISLVMFFFLGGYFSQGCYSPEFTNWRV